MVKREFLKKEENVLIKTLLNFIFSIGIALFLEKAIFQDIYPFSFILLDYILY